MGHQGPIGLLSNCQIIHYLTKFLFKVTLFPLKIQVQPQEIRRISCLRHQNSSSSISPHLCVETRERRGDGWTCAAHNQLVLASTLAPLPTPRGVARFPPASTQSFFFFNEISIICLIRPRLSGACAYQLLLFIPIWWGLSLIDSFPPRFLVLDVYRFEGEIKVSNHTILGVFGLFQLLMIS